MHRIRLLNAVLYGLFRWTLSYKEWHGYMTYADQRGISSRFGRKRAAQIPVVVMLIFTVTTGLCPNFFLYMASQFILGLGYGGYRLNGVILGKVYTTYYIWKDYSFGLSLSSSVFFLWPTLYCFLPSKRDIYIYTDTNYVNNNTKGKRKKTKRKDRESLTHANHKLLISSHWLQ